MGDLQEVADMDVGALAQARPTAAPSSATGESSSSLSAGMDEGVSAVNGAQEDGPSFSVGAVVLGLPWTDGGGHTARIYGEGFPCGRVEGQAEKKRLSNGDTALCYQVWRADHSRTTFWPARLLRQTCLALGSSGPGGRQSTAERNAKRKANELTKQTKEVAAQRELKLKETEEELKRSRKKIARVEKEAEKQQKNAGKKINKMKHDAEKELRALERKVAAANKQAEEKGKMRKGEELKRRRAVKTAEEAQIAEGVTQDKLARQKRVNESLKKESEKQRASLMAKCVAVKEMNEKMREHKN